jgi:hypothetical protein
MPALVSGTPVGNLQTAEDIYLEGAPTIYFQDYNATLLKNPDADGFYWGLSGTTTYPVYELGCLTAVSLTENLTVNDVLCDNVGVKATIQQRNYFEFQMTVQSFFPLTTLRNVLKGGPVTETAPTEKFGLGAVNNNQFWHVYAPKVYDEDAGDLVIWNFNKCQFVNAFTISMPFGSPWQITGVVFRAFADTTKPAAQRFGSVIRSDPSVIV